MTYEEINELFGFDGEECGGQSDDSESDDEDELGDELLHIKVSIMIYILLFNFN